MLLEQIAGSKRFDAMAFAIAGWIRFMTGVDEAGIAIDGIKDPQVRPQAVTGGYRWLQAVTSRTHW